MQHSNLDTRVTIKNFQTSGGEELEGAANKRVATQLAFKSHGSTGLLQWGTESLMATNSSSLP